MTEQTESFADQLIAAGRSDLALMVAVLDRHLAMLDEIVQLQKAIVASNEVVLFRLTRIEERIPM